MLLAASKETHEDKRSDQELVQAVQEGDRASFRVLVERYQSRAQSVALRVLRSEHEAEDVVQEAFVKAYLSIQSFKGTSKFYTWLYRIVFNMAIDFRRKKQRRGGDTKEYVEELLASETLEISGKIPEAQVGDRQLLSIVQKAMRELSEEHRSVLCMREVDGLSYEEIASLLGVNKGTIMSRLFYARKNLLKILARHGVKKTESGSFVETHENLE